MVNEGHAGLARCDAARGDSTVSQLWTWQPLPTAMPFALAVPSFHSLSSACSRSSSDQLSYRYQGGGLLRLKRDHRESSVNGRLWANRCFAVYCWAGNEMTCLREQSVSTWCRESLERSYTNFMCLNKISPISRESLPFAPPHLYYSASPEIPSVARDISSHLTCPQLERALRPWDAQPSSMHSKRSFKGTGLGGRRASHLVVGEASGVQRQRGQKERERESSTASSRNNCRCQEVLFFDLMCTFKHASRVQH